VSRVFNGKKCLQQIILGKLERHMEKNEVGPNSYEN
jgi:hypothetical protein